jgi:hypothetical protein
MDAFNKSGKKHQNHLTSFERCGAVALEAISFDAELFVYFL